MQKVVAIVGPTAVGKTSLAIELAKKLDGEIVSGDSMQIYKEVAIGTAKASRRSRQKSSTTWWMPTRSLRIFP